MKSVIENEVLCRSIFDAIRINNLPAVKAYLVFGATVTTRDTMGWTPLHHAAWHNHQEIFAYFISLGADLHAPSRTGETPFHCALRNDSKDVLACVREMRRVA